MGNLEPCCLGVKLLVLQTSGESGQVFLVWQANLFLTIQITILRLGFSTCGLKTVLTALTPQHYLGRQGSYTND